MSKAKQCPNCTKPVGHEEDGCVLASLFAIVRDRGNTPKRKIKTLWANADVDALWSTLGPIVDDLEEGAYS